MRSHPFHNVKDVKKLAERAFSEVSEQFVWNCYRHVEEQEEYYKKLSKIDPIPAEDLESWEITEVEPAIEVFEDFDQEPQEHFLSAILESNSAESELQPVEIPIEDIIPQETPKLRNLRSLHQCDQCPKTFSGNQAKRNLERHLKKHELKTVNSYNCDECDKSFKFHSYLKRHLEKNHKKEPPTLELPVVEEHASDHVIESNSRRKQKMVARKLF